MDKQANRTLAICIALLPPIWAVAAPYIGVTTGAVALICAGLCAANGDKRENALPISIGFLLGDLWAVLAGLGTIGGDLIDADKQTGKPGDEEGKAHEEGVTYIEGMTMYKM